jgi:hypothetical protein
VLPAGAVAARDSAAPGGPHGGSHQGVLESERLIRIMEVVRAIGNFMNTYSGTGAAVVEGFTVDSLLQVGCLCVHDVSVAKP